MHVFVSVNGAEHGYVFSTSNLCKKNDCALIMAKYDLAGRATVGAEVKLNVM